MMKDDDFKLLRGGGIMADAKGKGLLIGMMAEDEAEVQGGKVVMMADWHDG